MAVNTEEKLERICESAEWFFIREGYHNTQISGIAKKTGIAVGSVYKLFMSKKALFQYVVLRVFHRAESMGKGFPISELSDVEFLKNIKSSMQENPFLTFREEVIPQSFEAFLTETFDFMYDFGPAFLIFERNQCDFREACNSYGEMRLQFIKYFENCVEYYIKQNEIRDMEKIPFHARLMIETMSWWGMHVRYDIFDMTVTRETSKEIVLDALIHAYKK